MPNTNYYYHGRSTEDSLETYTAPAARIVAVYERAVLLTMTERRRLDREWAAADERTWNA